MQVLLLSTYELGRQPFGLASPAAHLRQAGAMVTCLDLAVQDLDPAAVASAGLVAFYVPMHTATRLAVRRVEEVRAINPAAHLCFYGLYAPMNAAFLRSLGAGTILGGEYEAGLVALVQRLTAGTADTCTSVQREPLISLQRQHFLVPDRCGLPELPAYAQIAIAGEASRVTGYTEATRGCKHRCRHCPIVPVYGGVFRVVPPAIVLADIDRQVAAGARHITFGDPDFLNGPGHALALVEALHAAHPDLTYDVTIKVEHLLKHAALLPRLRDSGCLFITSAVESLDDAVLARFDKGHTRADIERVVALMRTVGLPLSPTFVTFTPWTTLANYIDLLASLLRLDLVEHVAPVQYAIRLLVPAGSLLLDLPEVEALVEPYDAAALTYPWHHPDPRVDELYERVRAIVAGAADTGSRSDIFAQIWCAAHAATGSTAPPPAWRNANHPGLPIPHASEPWFC